MLLSCHPLIFSFIAFCCVSFSPFCLVQLLPFFSFLHSQYCIMSLLLTYLLLLSSLSPLSSSLFALCSFYFTPFCIAQLLHFFPFDPFLPLYDVSPSNLLSFAALLIFLSSSHFSSLVYLLLPSAWSNSSLSSLSSIPSTASFLLHVSHLLLLSCHPSSPHPFPFVDLLPSAYCNSFLPSFLSPPSQQL